MMRLILRPCAAALIFVPALASAHPSIGGASGFSPGFAHPLNGLDHVLAMVAVGLFAVHLGGRALWLVPLTFVSVMAFSGIAGMEGMHIPFVEVGIGMSVVVLGLAVAFQLSVPVFVAASLVGVFAIFHGHAHGAEMSTSLSGLTFGLGFVCATALLHATGAGLGIAIGKTSRAFGHRAFQVGGSAMTIAGMAIVVSP